MILRAINLLILVGTILISFSCDKQQSKRHYEEISSSPFLLQPTSNQSDPKQLLKEMIARGEDPHAFMREGQEEKDPHAFMQNEPMSKEMMQAVPLPPHISESPVLWQTPPEWVEKSGSGMRLASFSSESYPGLDVSIVSLGGVAGGLSANINRWLNQIKLPEMNEESLEQFLSKQEKFTSDGGLSVMLVDFASLQNDGAPATPSMLSGVIQEGESTVFVKMTGTLEDINKNRSVFKAFCQSLKHK